MRDKEKNNSLKNQDKNFNENFTQEKEQIMIDGVDVNKCERHCSDNYNTPNMCYSDITRGYRHCNPKENQCDFYITSIEEQLARKTQECENLKESVDKIKNYVKNQMFDVDCKNWFDRFIYTFKDWKKSICEANDRYRKALEEIEGLVKNFCKDCDDYEDCNWDKEGCYYSLIPNLKDIINNAKGNNNEANKD